MPRCLLTIVTITIAFVFPFAQAAASGPERPIVSYTLDNGLQVVLAPDSTVPKAVTYLRYRVGSMNEPAGRSGFAHLFEHLMFSGTKSWPNVFGAHSGNGNEINAYTFEDGTVYFAEGSSANLPMMLSLEADRMANLGGEVEQSELDLQRSVVKNEMRQNVLDKPAMSGWEAMWGGLFPKNHPYSRSVIGSIPDLDAATLNDVHGFFNVYYVPNNAVLAVVGDFEVETARALVADTFGRIPRGGDVPWPVAEDTEPTRIRLELEDRLPSDLVAFAYSGPRDGRKENAALELGAEILGNGEYGYLRQRLIVDEKVASYVSAGWWRSLLAGRFTVESTVLEGVSAEVLEDGIRTALTDFLAGSIDAADLERARKTLLRRARLSVEPYNSRAERIVYGAVVHGDGGAAITDDPDLLSITAEEVIGALRAVIDPELASIMVIRTGERGGYPAVLTESSGEAEPFDVASRPVVDIPVLAPTEPRTAQVPDPVELALSNGARLIHYERPGAPQTYVAALAEGGWTNAAPNRPGLISMAMRMGPRGAGGMDYPTFAKAAKDIGADIGYSVEDQVSGITLGVAPQDLDRGLALMALAIREPNFDAGEWEHNRTEMVETLAWRRNQIDEIALRAGENVLMPATPDMPRYNWDLELLREMTLDEARDAYAFMFQPHRTTFISIGDATAEDIATAISSAFDGWTRTADGFDARPPQPAVFQPGRRVMVIPEPGASQSAIYVMRPAPGYLEDTRSESIAVSRLLATDFAGRLNSVIREEKGYSYGVGGGVYSTLPKGSILYASATVERHNTGPALVEFLKGFDELKTIPVEEEELGRTRMAYRGTLANAAETAANLIGSAISMAGMGLTLNDYFTRNREMETLSLEAVRAKAVELGSLDNSLIVVAGDPEHVLPQLREIGITDIQIAEQSTSTQPQDRALDLDTAPTEPRDELAFPRGRTADACAGTATVSGTDCIGRGGPGK